MAVRYLDYIENEIGAYLDLGITGNQDTEIEIKANVVSSTVTHAFLCGNVKTLSSGISITAALSTTSITGNSRFGAQVKMGAYQVSTGDWHVFKINNIGCYVDGEAVHTWGTTVADFTTDGTLWLFALNGGTTYPVNQIEYCKVRQSGVLVADLRACLDPDGVACMYDELSQTYSYNAGTETFIAGSLKLGTLCRLPKRITKAASDGVNYVEYIRTSGTQYFNTDYIPNAKTRIVLDVVWDGTVTKCLFGTRNAASNTDTYNNSLWIMTDGLPRCDYYGTSLKGTEAVPTTRTTVERNANVTTINGTSITNTASTNTSQYPLFLFAMNTAGTAEKIGTFDCYQNGIQIYDDGVTLTHDYRPAIDPDGIVCLYDRVTKTYLYMSGSGTLEAGASISGGSSDMTVTIAGTSTVPNGIVTINGTAYSSDQMVNITAGTSIAVYLGNDTDENCYIYLDGTQVDSGDPAEYTFVAANSVTITFSSSGEMRKCHITTE